VEELAPLDGMPLALKTPNEVCAEDKHCRHNAEDDCFVSMLVDVFDV